MPWVMLVIAGLLEVVWALMLKKSEGLSKPVPTVIFFISLALSLFLLSQAVKSVPVGTAYAVWTGVGVAGTAILGMLLLGESRDMLKLVSIVLIVGGIIGLRLTTSD